MLASFLSGEFVLHIPCCIHFYLGSFSYTFRASFTFTWGVSLTHPMLHLPFCGEFLLHIPCCLLFLSCFSSFFNLGSFSYTARAGFTFIWRVSLTHPMQDLVFCGEFLLHIPCWLLFLIWGVSLTHPMLALLFCGETLTHTKLGCCCCCFFLTF